MKTFLLAWLLVAALDVPTVKVMEVNQTHVRLAWSHPDCYQFDIRQVSDGNTTTNTVFFRTQQIHKKHEFVRSIKLNGATNKISFRAINDENVEEKSEWSKPISVIP